ncbi:hypothetical protein DVQ18_18900 [Yersinia enterocolitica]|nr:hypothetical protein [Yersinia enterocolitica]EKN5121982.1 hypothetical protein [Yersinia enterocolitica]EKN5128792.1 hypothetical protein [Yersinia enterocolitica]EKN5132762.1 hypothetical protein [Yersinia enterocolitica]EKN5137548.1 hypothetical protein [Yersinia enterocolitica]
MRPLQAAFKSAPSRFVTRITYLCKLIGINEPCPLGSPFGQHKCCSNRFPTDLLFVCCLAATPNSFGRSNSWRP